jgi:hypothetical protein
MNTWKEALARVAAGGTITREELRQIIARSGGRTAAESERLFRACPEWVAEQKAREAEQEARKQRSKEEQALLLADLRRVGYRLETVWNLVNTADSYPEAIPVLLDHIKRSYKDVYREGMARALTVREARGVAGPVIIDVLRNAEGAGQQLRWALANALTIVADRTDRDAIKALIDAESDPDVKDRLKRALKTAAKP